MTKKILILNQPVGNRGDEAAFRALVGKLSQHKDFELEVLLAGRKEGVTQEIINSFSGPRVHNAKYLDYKSDFILHRFPHRSFFMPKLFVKSCEKISPALRTIVSAIKRADVVLCAPGGVCMGPYQNWSAVWSLSKAMELKKPVAVYSRSIGPFPESSDLQIVFRDLSINILKSACFLSLRDSKSWEYADQYDLGYVRSIDTAFLERPLSTIPKQYEFIKERPFVVFVPNELNAWHHAFRGQTDAAFVHFYGKILKHLLAKGVRVVMIPQTCKPSVRRDYDYFKRLASALGDDVVVVSDDLDSAVQQSIVSSSAMVVGARYHSIVFAINNGIPFVSLAYEHKMTGLLDLLDLNRLGYVLSVDGIEKADKALQMIDDVYGRLGEHVCAVKRASNKATQMAEDCFEHFLAAVRSC